MWQKSRSFCRIAERQKDGFDVIGPSAIAISTEAGGSGTVTASDDSPTPREMTEEEIWQVIEDFAKAAKNAVEKAGFDGVEGTRLQWSSTGSIHPRELQSAH